MPATSHWPPDDWLQPTDQPPSLQQPGYSYLISLDFLILKTTINDQQDDRGDQRGDETSPLTRPIPSQRLPEQTRQKRTGGAERDGRNEPHVRFARMQHLGSQADGQAAQQGPHNTH